MRCYHLILRISYTEHVTNEEACAKIQQATCSSGLAKIILQGTVKGEEDKADRKRDGKTT